MAKLSPEEPRGRTRVGLVGVNERARRLLLKGLAGSPRGMVSAVCSRDIEKARRTAAEVGPRVRAFGSVEQMVHSGEVDAVLVNTPAATHYRICMAAIRAGCAVICEKPLAASTAGAIALREAAAKAPGVVNFTYRSMPGYRLTEQWLAAHRLGRPVYAEFALLQGHHFLPGFGQTGGSVPALLESGVHLFDTLSGLCGAAGFGRVSQVCATPMLDERAVDYGWSFTGRSACGAAVSAAFHRRALGWHNGLHWSLYGDEGAITVELDSGRTHVRVARPNDSRPQGIWRTIDVPPELQGDDARFPEYHMDRLVGAIRGEEPFPDFAAAVATHQLADALAASAASGRWAAVEAV